MTSITIPDSITTFGEGVFDGCQNLQYNEFDNAKYLGNAVNKHLVLVKASSTDITSCSIDVKCAFVLDKAFSGRSSLTSITIPDSVKSIGSCAFYNCTGLTSVTIGNGVTSIGNYAFQGCSGLTSIKIPDSVTSIGSRTFYNCFYLTNIVIGNGVTSIGSYAFSYCRDLTRIDFNGTKAQWETVEKGNNWGKNTGDFTVYCTDGTISKSEA